MLFCDVWTMLFANSTHVNTSAMHGYLAGWQQYREWSEQVLKEPFKQALKNKQFCTTFHHFPAKMFFFWFVLCFLSVTTRYIYNCKKIIALLFPYSSNPTKLFKMTRLFTVSSIYSYTVNFTIAHKFKDQLYSMCSPKTPLRAECFYNGMLIAL